MDRSVEVPAALPAPLRSSAGTGGFSRLPDSDDEAEVNVSNSEAAGGRRSSGRASGSESARVVQIMQILRKVRFAKNMDSESLYTLARAAERAEYSRDEVVIREGEPGDSLFIIVSGSFDVVKETAYGQERVYTFQRPGDHFGEASVLDPKLLRTATIEATTPKAVVLRLKRRDVLPILTEQISKIGKEGLLNNEIRKTTEVYDAPKYLENQPVTYLTRHLETLFLGRTRIYWGVLSLLVLAPFVAVAGRVARLAYGCPEISTQYDTMMCAGIFSFCFVWPFLFWDFAKAVRGVSRIEQRVQYDHDRANAHVLASGDTDEEDLWLSAADRYRALRVATFLKAEGDSMRPQMRRRFLSKAYDSAITATSRTLSESHEEDEVDDSGWSDTASVASILQAGHLLHVRGIGQEGWDGTYDGRARFENKEELLSVFSEFGPVLNVSVRHRIQDGANTSWALVTMGTTESIEAVLAAPAVVAGSTELTINRFDKKQAVGSKGMTRKMSQKAVHGISMEAAAAVSASRTDNASASHVASTLQAGHLLHVRGIGQEGWDGTHDGRARFENEEELLSVFSEFGPVLNVSVRHRIQDGANTSWALVTMGTTESIEAVLAAPAVVAGSTELTINRFDKKQAVASKGQFRKVSQQAVAAVRIQNAKNLSDMVGKRAAALAKEQAIFEAKRDTMREAVANSFEVHCEISLGHGGAALTQDDEDLLRAEFEEADVDGNGVLSVDEWAPLVARILGIPELREGAVQKVSTEALEHDTDGDGQLSVEEFIQMWNDKTKGTECCGMFDRAPGSGPLCQLSFQGGLGIERQKLTRKLRLFLRVQLGVDCILGVMLVLGVVHMSVGMIEMMLYYMGEEECEDCKFDEFARFLSAFGVECVPHAMLIANMIGIVLVLIPASLVAALLWPLWLYSLQIAVVFAAADVTAVLRELRPRNVRRWQTEALMARKQSTDDDQLSRGEMLWQTDVALPGAMLIITMKGLSEWGTSLGASIFGCCAFGLGLLPYAFYSEWSEQVKAAIIGVVILP